MARYDKRQLYIKRVLREIRRHSDDRWIDIEIEKDLRDRFGDKTDVAAVKEMPSWRLTAMNYRLKYFQSAEALDGFTPHNVKRFLRNFAAPAIELLSAFVVFRLYPTTEYIAYVVCALAAVAAAVQQHVCFVKLKYMIAAMVAPAFLLIWYPAKAAAAQADGLWEFFGNLFSPGNRYVLVLIAAFLLFFSVTSAVLHARDYADKPLRPAVIFGGLGLAIASVAIFCGITAHRNHGIALAAERDLAGLEAAYTEYLSTGDIAPLLLAAQSADETVEKNFHTLTPMDQTYGDSFEKAFTLFHLCRTAELSGSYSELMDAYYTDYDENDTARTLNTEAIVLTCNELSDRFVAKLSSSDGRSYADLHSLASTAEGLHAELYSVIDECHTAWIFSSAEEE